MARERICVNAYEGVAGSESPFVRPQEAAKLGTEYERVQKEMDEKLGEWEKMQG